MSYLASKIWNLVGFFWYQRLQLIFYVRFLSPEVALFLYKSLIRSWLEYCCHVLTVAPSFYLEMLGKLQKWICRTVGPSLDASLEPWAHRQNVASLTIFYRYKLLSKHYCLQPFFHKDWVFLLFAKSVYLDLQIAGKCISDTLFDFKAYVVHRW